MKIMLVVLAAALAAAGCASPKSGTSDTRYGSRNDSRTHGTARVDGDRDPLARTSGDDRESTARENERERASNAGRTGYDHSTTEGVTAGGTTYRTTGNPGNTNGTAWTQSGDADARFTTVIRTRISDAGLSMNARNAKVTTENGRVTLRGRVDSDQERETIARIARDVAGSGNVNDNLEVVMAR